MPNTREKLIELLTKPNILCDDCGTHGNSYCIEAIADHLIDNGVTVQQWIPVSERLPENDTYILATTDGVAVSAYWHNDRFYAFTANGVAMVGCVTHWMPLPEPPKGD